MARVKKAAPTLDALFFATPEQKVLRYLLSESTSTLTPRVISSKLKGVRGLGGADGISKILEDFDSLGMVEFVDNKRAVRLNEDNNAIRMMKTFSSLCDLETLKALLEPLSTKGILFGSRATGRARTDSDYDLFVVTDNATEVERIARAHPLGRNLELVTFTQGDYDNIESRDATLAQKLEMGIVLWGSSW